ncbi:MAG: nitrogen regulation protein NR(I), partial [Gammaproteobacteria bacterium]|nr:nitrogen regulation protein NR(I) [Gammaproteobacteria bacterium]
MSLKGHIWVVDDDRAIRWVLEKALRKVGLEVTLFSDGEEVLSKLEYQHP